MNNTELLQEHRGMGWPDVSQSLASPRRQKFAAKIAELRRAALADPVAYRSRCEREERSAALATPAVRKVNALPPSMLRQTDAELRAKIARMAQQILADRAREARV